MNVHDKILNINSFLQSFQLKVQVQLIRIQIDYCSELNPKSHLKLLIQINLKALSLRLFAIRMFRKKSPLHGTLIQAIIILLPTPQQLYPLQNLL